MRKIVIDAASLNKGSEVVSRDGENVTLKIPSGGGGISLPQLAGCPERYLTFYIEALTDHSVPMEIVIIPKNTDAKKQDIRFGIMPRFRVLICIDLQWLDGNVLFPGHTEGELKVVCHGGRIIPEDIKYIGLEAMPSYHDITICITDLILTDERPEKFPIPDDKLIDEFGQYKKKDWPGKIKNCEELKNRLHEAAGVSGNFSIDGWSRYGGYEKNKLSEGTGFFTVKKSGGRWWLADPDGNAFFSAGPCCTVVRADCRVDGVEKLLDWLPARDDPEYGHLFSQRFRPYHDAGCRPDNVMFSFEEANLYRAFGSAWYEKWTHLISGQFRENGLNTLANWSDRKLFGTAGIPYVFMLDRFPGTKKFIFRDFPDVLSDEYAEDAEMCAEFLTPYMNDPFMIGYFLRNEPAWAFVDNLMVADEVLYNPDPSVCKDKLIQFLMDKYITPQALSKAWNHRFDNFDDLRKPVFRASGFSPQALADQKEFSRILLGAYVTIPSRACRSVDQNHLNLGMRWAWISDPDIITGWENFDVFSINCYAVDPTSALDNVVKLGVDLPIVIGEFHFGALDTGLTATGLEGVANQHERGRAYRYYCERVAAHPSGVGCHWFQCYDQFALGRFDGENYNIGLFDICSLPNRTMMQAVKQCAKGLYQVMEGSVPPAAEKPVSIPMIAY
ncbi:MAG: hypothetical protein FWG89_04225 [Treponema sp.]|nr:hypothetical protein [Treponema sp.]